MKFSELVTLFQDYENALYSPSRSEVKFGCDCGCGGDSYTAESWDEEEQYAADSIVKMKEFCTKYGIYYDGIE